MDSLTTYTVRVTYYPYGSSGNWGATLYASDGNGGINNIGFTYNYDVSYTTKTINVLANDFLVLKSTSNASYPYLTESYSPNALIKVFETGYGVGNMESVIVYKVVDNVIADLRN